MPSLNKKNAPGTLLPSEHEHAKLIINILTIGMIIAVKYRKLKKETPQQNTTTTRTTPSTVNPAISIVAESVITACFLGTKE